MHGMRSFNYQDLWASIRREPLVSMLLLSLSLHAAVVMLIQPRRYSAPMQTVVINARLEPGKPAARPALPSVPPKVETPVPPVPEIIKPLEKVSPVKPDQPPAPSVPEVPAAIIKPVPDAKPADVPEQSIVQPAASAAPALPSIPVMVDSTWYEARQLDVQPKASQPVNPVYPPDAQRRNQQGTVKLKLKVDEFGVVKDVKVEEGDPPGVFDESALAAFKKAHFEPAMKNGQPVRALIYIRVRYELGDF
jgi:protein TonB